MGAHGIIKSEGCENRERGEPAVETVSHPLTLRSFEGRGLLNEEGDNERERQQHGNQQASISSLMLQISPASQAPLGMFHLLSPLREHFG